MLNLIISLLITLLFFGFFFIGPIVIIWIRSRRMNLELSIHDAWRLKLFKLTKKEILEDLFEFQSNGFIVSLEDYAAHLMVGGDIKNCLNGLHYARKIGLSTKFSQVTAFDLAGFDVKETIRKSGGVYHLEINGLANEFISIHYSIDYKYTSPWMYADKRQDQLKEKISDKLGQFLNTWQMDNVLEAEQRIRTEYLTPDYFENTLEMAPIQQDYKIELVRLFAQSK